MLIDGVPRQPFVNILLALQSSVVNPLIEFEQLCDIFPEQAGEDLVQSAEHVARDLVPEPYQQLLVHEHHMTVTMEHYHRCRVDVEVLAADFVDQLYCRKILLRLQSNRRVVQFGVVRFNFQYVDDSIRAQIESQHEPLGRVLIQHDVLRHIDLGALLRLETGPGLARYFNARVGTETFGRLATIFCNGMPAVDLLEISAPLNEDVTRMSGGAS